MKKYLKYLPYVILITALLSTLTSLYFSEILKLAPCVLCWSLRIAMFPLVPISVVGILKKDKNLPLYILPLSIGGWLISLYHNLLYYHIIPEAIAPCQQGVSCTQKLLDIFGFIDIPQGAFLAFTFINLCTIIYLKSLKKKI
jgi:disulfide bond formation protein DsbB